jgi:hypothetical protein
MFGVRNPHMPRFQRFRFQSPMSSPMMTRMLGFFPPSCAGAAGAERTARLRIDNSAKELRFMAPPPSSILDLRRSPVIKPYRGP